ncbi:MAG: [protein-PII] uridylyltransferase [Gammaproteobacteria bacterium]|nr:[protein-PII] uridylyltransferase [Gammaproteobacteria bacterium]NND60673.1 [protein-PII] uridylyltransferase [Gammaproteobacteria bacterium]
MSRIAGAAENEDLIVPVQALHADSSLAAFRNALAASELQARKAFDNGTDIVELIEGRAAVIDHVLQLAWRRFNLHDSNFDLVAVGGYGRGELHPHSDIDFLVLLPDDPTAHDDIAAFVTFLWDLGLEAGHSVRTIADCARESRADITVATALMESRLLSGDGELHAVMRKAVGPGQVWPTPAFFEAKLAEQRARHKRYDDTAYKLEPNVKGSPGGLRDIQMIGWVAKRHFGAQTYRELVDHGFLTAQEHQRLRQGRNFLWQLRFALHVLTGRREDRLLFDHQARIANMLGYRNADNNLAVEQLMQRYYRTIMELALLNEMLLQLFREAILLDPQAPVTPVHPQFQVRNDYLETVGDDVFVTHPQAMLEVFGLLQQHPELHGLSASAIRLLRANIDIIDEHFRNDPHHQHLFMGILRAPRFVTHVLRRMNAYGVLGRYLPAFGDIVGRMQYDLFHAYTVDAHTLFVLRNLRRFARSEPDPDYPQCAEIMQSLPQPEIAYLAALFHDIAKGRGGDHSELGAVDAEAFCLTHGLGRYEARLVAWLVRNHLVLSVTAQKKDIDDPRVIHDFATEVGDERHLNFLYVLTVADVTGTDPKLWNSWKASLFHKLYLLTRQALRRGLENPIDKDTLIGERQQQARALLHERGVSTTVIDQIWERFAESYFLRHSGEEIAWHTQTIAGRPADSHTSLVALQATGTLGGTSIFVYSPPETQTFAISTAVLEELGLNILDARVSKTETGDSLDTFRVSELHGEPIDDAARLDDICTRLGTALGHRTRQPAVTRRAPRRVRMFNTTTELDFNTDTYNRRTIMELTAADRPGLLSRIGRVFTELGIEIETAKITTVGERAEDVFYITGSDGNALDQERCQQLHDELTAALGTL